MSNSATPGTAARQASLSIINSQCLSKLMSIELVMPSNHLILCCLLLLPPSIFPSIRVFPMSQLFASGGQVLEFQLQYQSFQWIFRLWDWRAAYCTKRADPMNIQDWSPLGWTGWISLHSKGISRVFSNTKVQKHQFFSAQLSLSPTFTSIHDYWKNHSLD